MRATHAIRIVAGIPAGAALPAQYSWRVVRDVLTPMRDGTLLAMDLLRPEELGRFPVILIRTPYNEEP